MELAKQDLTAVKENQTAEDELRQLSDLQLVLVGGGIGDVIVG
jgi:hypothetical protein